MQGNNNDQQASKATSHKNYLKPLKKNEDEHPKTEMKDKEDLHAMLHKLKNYYNELNKLKKQKATQLQELKNKHSNLNKQIEDKIAFSDIDFTNERIAIQDYEKFKDAKETKDTIRIKIENLISEKNQLLQKYENEIEYGNKINNMIKIEKRNYDDTYEHILQTQEKLSTLKAAQRNLEINKEEKQKKEKMFSKVQKDLDSEMIKLDDVIDYQTKNYFNIVGELKAKNEANQQKKKEIETKDSNLDLQHKKSSEKIISEIQKSKMIKMQNTEKESYVIKLILGLDIIKRYFIDVVKQGKEINTVELIKSEDYKTFKSEKFSIRENNYDSVNSNNYSNNTNNNFFNKNNNNNNNNNLNNNNINNNNNNNFNSTNYNNNNFNNSNNFNSSELNFKSNQNNNTTQEDERNQGRSRISLKSLKEKLDNLDLDYEKIYDFYTKIMNKTNFFHSHMINFNLKQISLEGKKEQYTDRVKQIIAKNSKNIEDLRKFDAKFDYLFRNFENEIKSSNLYENLKQKVKDFDASPSQHADFYKKCSRYLSDLKTFNEFLFFNFKRIKIACGDEVLFSALKDNYKTMKANVKNDKNANEVEKIDYVKDFFKTIELEFLKENKKFEKLLRAIDEYPGDKSHVSGNSRIKTEKSNLNNNNKDNNDNDDSRHVNFVDNYVENDSNNNVGEFSRNDISNLNNNDKGENESLNASGNIKEEINSNDKDEVVSHYSKHTQKTRDLDNDNINSNETKKNLSSKEEECIEYSQSILAAKLQKNEAAVAPVNDKNKNLNSIESNRLNSNQDKNNTSSLNMLEENLSPIKSNTTNNLNNNKDIENNFTNSNNNNNNMNISSNFNTNNNTNNNLTNNNNNNNNLTSNNINNNYEILKKKGTIFSNSENAPKSELSSNLNYPVDLVGGFPYITPYSGWPISKLEEEKEITIKKINALKSQMELGKVFEDKFNLNNLIILDVPFEKTLFYFFENTEKIVDTIKLAKDTTDVCAEAAKAGNRKPADELIRNKAVLISPEKNKIPETKRALTIGSNNYNYHSLMNNNNHNNKQLQETAVDYDSYSSDDGTSKKAKKNVTVHLSSNIAKANIKNRTSAPNLNDNRLTLQQAEKNQKITEKLYMPFIKDKSYKIEVNNNLTKIKEDSKNSAIFSHKLNKKKEEVDKIGKQLIIYNNPNINIDHLSNTTYNTIVKYIINNHMGSNQ